MVRKFKHRVHGYGTTFAVAEQNRLVTQVGQLLRVQARLTTPRRNCSHYTLTMVDGQVPASRVADTPAEDVALRHVALVDQQRRDLDVDVDVELGRGEPFSHGLTPAVEFIGDDGPWEVLVTLHVELL